MNEVKEIVNVKSGEDGTYKVVVEMKPMLLSYHQALHLCGRDMIDVFLSKHGLGNCKANLTELNSTDSDNQISIVNQILTEDGVIIFECIVHKELSLQEAFTLCGEQNVREIFLQKNIALETISTPIAVSTKSLPTQEKLSHNLLTLNKSLQKAPINPCLVEFSMSPTHSFIFPRVQSSTSLTWSNNSTLQFPLMSPGCFENNLPVATNKAAFFPQVPVILSLNIHSNNQPSSLITKLKPIKQNNYISEVTSQLLNKKSCLSADKPLLCWTSLSSSAQKQILKNIQATPKNKSSVLFFNSLQSPNSSSLKYFSCLTSAASFMHNKKTISLNPRSSTQPKLFEIQDTYLLNPFFTGNATTYISDPKIQDKLVAKSEMVFQSKFTKSNPQSSCSEEISQCNYSETVPQNGFVNLNHQFNEATIQTNLNSKTFYKCRYCGATIAHRLSFLLHENTCIKKVENCSLKSQPFLFQNTKEEIISNAKVTSSVITRVKDASAASASLNLNFGDIKPFKVFKGKKLLSESLSLNFSKVASAVVSAHQTLSFIGYGGLGNENKNLVSLANTNTAPENDVSPISNDSATPISNDPATPTSNDSATPTSNDSATPIPPNDSATPISNDSATPISDDSATPTSNDSATPTSNDSATIDLHEPFQVCFSKDVCSTQQSSDLKSTLGFLSTLTNDSSLSDDKLFRDEIEISELIQVELTKPPIKKRKYFSSIWLTEPTEKNNKKDRILLDSTPNIIDNRDIDFKINVFSPDEKITNIDCLTFTACQASNTACQASNSLYKYNKNTLTLKTLHEVDGDQRMEALSNKFRNKFKKHQRTLPLPTMKSVLPSFHDTFLCKNKLSDNILDNSVALISHIEDNHKNEISSDTSKYTRRSIYQRDGVDSVLINNPDLDLHANETPTLSKSKDIELTQNNDKNFIKRNGASLKRPLPSRSCKKSIPKTIMVKNVINDFQYLKVRNKVSNKLSLGKLNVQKLPNKNDKKSYHNFCKESPLKESRISNLKKKKKVSAGSIMNRLTPGTAKIAKKFSRKNFQNNNLHNLFEGSQFQFSSLTVSKTRHGREFKGFFTQQSFLNDANNCSKDLKKTIGIKEKKLKSRTLCGGGKNTLKNHLKMLLEESATFSTPRLTGRTRQGREFKAFSVSPFSLKSVDKKSASTVQKNSLSHAEKNSSVESNAVSVQSPSLDFFESSPRFNQNKLCLNSSEELQKIPQTAGVIMRNEMESASTTDSSGKRQSNCRNRNKVGQPLLKIKFSKLFPSTHLDSTPLSEESEKSSKRPRNLISQLKPSMKDAKSSLTTKRNQLSTFFTEYNQSTKYSDVGSFQSPITKKFAFKNQQSETLSGSLCGESSMIFQNEKSINLTCETLKKTRKKQKCNRKYSDKSSPKTIVDSFTSHLTISDQNEQILSKTEGSLPFRTQEKPTLKKNSCKLNRTSSSFIETIQATLDLKSSSATENVASDTRSSGTASEIFLKTFQKFQTKDSMMLDRSNKTRKGKYYKRFSPGFSPFYPLRSMIGFKDRPNVATDNTVINKNAARERSHYFAIKMEKVLRVNALLTSEQLADLAKDKGYKYLT